MNSIKILVSTTLRDFSGSENDRIQKMFLKSLEDQTYKNFEVVITLFGEKNVKNEVKKFQFESYFYNDIVEVNYRYSLSKVVLNTIQHAKEKHYNNYIILWTTSDVIYDKNFFYTIIKNYRRKIIGTSHPHVIFSSIEGFEKGIIKERSRLFSGFDLIYFDKEFIENEKIINALNSYIFHDWGVFEHFLISLNELSPDVTMVNIYQESKVYKIENDRKLTNESNQFLINSHNLNSVIFRNFLYDNKVTDKYFNLTYCNLKFDLSKNKINYYINFSKDIIEYYFNNSMRRLIIKTISRVIPIKLKILIKKVIKGGKK